MNFLGHIYFSNNDPELMYANLFGDHVKGADLSNYPDFVRKGIMLHRSIDHYIDHHPAVVNLLHELYQDLPKVAGIAVDIYFDHLLASQWNSFHTMEYNDFLQRFYTHNPVHLDAYSDEFREFIVLLRKMDWMHHYPTPFGLMKACQGVSGRLSFPNELKNGHNVFHKFEDRIAAVFHDFMKDAIPYFQLKYSELGITQ